MAFGDIYRYPFTRSYHGSRNDISTFNAASTKFTGRIRQTKYDTAPREG